MNAWDVKALVFEREPDAYARWIESFINRFGEGVEEEVVWERSPSKFLEIAELFPKLSVVVVSFNTMTDQYSLPMLAEDLGESKIKPDIILVGDFPQSWIKDFRDRYGSHRVFELWACDWARKMSSYLTVVEPESAPAP